MEDWLLRRWGGLSGYLSVIIAIVTIFIVGVILLTFAIGLLLLVSYFLNTKVSDRVVFVTANLLNVLIFGAIMIQAGIYLVQAGIYKQQRDIMRSQWEATQTAIRPRLRIAKVEVVGLGVGRIPAFIVTLVNEGATDARDVSLHMQIENDSAVVKWDREQIVTVAANGKQDYFIKWWNESLTEQRLNGYDFVAPLKVSGFFQHANNARQSFCYKYYPWDGRPEGIPQFIPCDFDPNGVVEIPMADGRIMTMTSDGKKSFSVKSEEKPKPKEKDGKPN
jgi:hypothetical protein